MIDPTLSSGFASALEKGINTALCYDPGSRQKLKRLHACVIQFECRSPALNLFFEIDGEAESVNISSYTEKDITTKVSSTLLNLLFFFVSSDGPEISNLSDSGIQVMGNSAKLANLQSIIQELDIDWEQALIDLSSPLGEGANVISHQLASVIKTFLFWLRKSKSTIRNNIANYLREELRVIPTTVELNSFYEGVAELRSDTDRLRARIESITKTLSTN